jgi:hypothetical protein
MNKRIKESHSPHSEEEEAWIYPETHDEHIMEYVVWMNI